MRKTIKLAVITTLSFAGAIGVFNAAYAAPVYVSEPSSVQLCQTLNAPYHDYSNDNFTYSVDYSGISGSITTISQKGTNCKEFDLSGLYFSDNTPGEGTVTITNSNTATGYASTGSSSFTLHFAMRHTTDAAGNITGDEAKLAYIEGDDGKVEQLDFAFAKNYDPTHIELSKTVKGTGGNTNETFNFTVRINGESGANYTVKNTSTNATSTCAAATDCVISLKDGQSVQIGYAGTTNQIPVGTTYTITEQGATDYETYINDSTTNNKATGQKTAMPELEDNTFSYVNKKDGGVLTGVAFNILPYIVLAAISVGIIAYSKKTAK